MFSVLRLVGALALALLASCTANVRGSRAPEAHADDDAAAEAADAAVLPGEDAFVPGGATDAAVPPPTGMRSVLFSGHSLININSPSYFARLSERDGRPVRYQLQMGIGSPLSVRLACPRSGQQAEGNPISFDVMTELRTPGAYDTLVLTERHDIVTTILYESTTSMTRRYRDAIRDGNPAARTFLFESWYTIDSGNPAAFRARQERELVLWQCVASKVNESRGELAPMLVVPAGQAVSELVGDVLGGRAVGFSDLSDVFLDDVHLTPEANYLIALIHYGVVHQRSPVGLPHAALSSPAGSSPTLSPEAAAYLQSLAARFVDRTFADAALSQRSDADCASAIVPPCSAIESAFACREIVSAWRNDTAPVPMHTGDWCLR